MVVKFQTVLFLIIINISTVLINKKNLHFNVKNYFLECDKKRQMSSNFNDTQDNFNFPSQL